MGDAESGAFERVREALGQVQRLADRLDERVVSLSKDKLSHEDAQNLMRFALDGDEKLRGDVVERVNAIRIEMRTGFENSQTKTDSAIYKAVSESEGRIMGAINALAAPPALPGQPSTQRRGLPPLASNGLSAVSGAGFLYLVLAFLNFVPRPGG